MIHLQSIILETGLLCLLFTTLMFILALIKKDNSIADISWGAGLILVMVHSMVQSGETDLRKMIVSILILLWGMRQSYNAWIRNREKGEGPQYRKWRREWKFFALQSFFRIYLLQAFIMMIISAPAWYIGFIEGELLGGWDLLGLAVFGAGFMTEIMADSQLAAFKKDPSSGGKILTTGLWSVSRHPRCFGEILVWCGIGCYALSLPDGWMTFTGPVFLTFVRRFCSVRRVEKGFENQPGWEEYRNNTAPLIPFVKFF